MGGLTAGAGNLISGNDQGGVAIHGIDAVGDVVQGNLIGTDITGIIGLGNQYSGVYVGDWGNYGDAASDTTIGGTAAGAGNVISDNGNWGLWITGAGTTGVVVQENLIGTDSSGTDALGNASGGVEIEAASANTIGGITAAAGNVISGNGDYGVGINNEGYSGGGTDNLVQGNRIGTNVTGTVALGNASWGVELQYGASNNTVGGGPAGAGNVISGNDEGGVEISSGDGNVVQGNRIGTDVTGTNGLGNASSGIYVDEAFNTTIGGTAAGAGNVISDNGGYGVWLAWPTEGAVVQGNLIGTDSSGAEALGNAQGGVEIGGTSDNTVGGTSPGRGQPYFR